MPDAGPRAARPGASGLKKAVGSVVAAIILLAAIEFLARVVETIEADLTHGAADFMPSMFAGSPDVGWTRKPGFRGIAQRNNARVFDDRGYDSVDSDQIGNTGRAKVVFIGDSSTFGHDLVAAATFVEVADRALPEADAINLGVPGYSSLQGVGVAKAYLPLLKPAIAVISFNFNDRRYALTPSAVDSPQRFADLYRQSNEYPLHRIATVAHYSYMFRGVHRAMQLFGLGPQTLAANRTVNLDEVRPRVDEESYRKNLIEMVRLCVANGVRPVFILLRDNPTFAGPVRAAISSMESGDPAAAIAELSRPVQRSLLNDIVHLYLAKAYRQVGDTRQADMTVQVEAPVSKPDGQNPIRLDTPYNRIMREVATAEGADLIDAAALLDTIPSAFMDVCHFNEEGHRLVGELVARHLRQILHPTSGS